jgi:flagellum-specific peptidoglycan hydrolase FlgJ
MKKLSSILTAVLFASFILTSCGEKSETAETPTTQSTSDAEPAAGASTDATESTEAPEAPEAPEAAETSSDFDCDEFISDYESFVTKYIALLKKQKANPSDMSVMTDAAAMMQEATDMQSNASKCTDPKYASKLAALAQKIAKAASGM